MSPALSALVAFMAVQAPVAQHLPPAVPAESAPATGCRVAGIVTDQRTGAGIAGASVVLRPAPHRKVPPPLASQPQAGGAPCASGCEAAADGDGRFEFRGLAPGAYTVAAALPGFTESPPLAVSVAGPSCAASVEIPYRLQMQAQARAEMPRALDTTPIASPIAPALTGEAIGATPGALEDMSRAFQSQPGVAASQDNRNDLLVRGGGALENQTRIDGFDVPNPNHFGAQGGSGGALSILPPGLIRRGSLEVGGFSVAFGDRMSSVADISLRTGRRDRLHGTVGAGIGGLMAVAEGALGSRGAWLVSARRSFLDALFHEQTGEVIPTYADALVKAEHRVGTRHAVTWLAIGMHDRASAHDEKAGDDEIRGDETVGLAGVRVDSEWSARSTTTVVASITTAEVDARAVDGAIVDGMDRGRDVEIRARAEIRRKDTPAGTVMAGAAVKAYHYDYDLYVNDLWTPYETVNRDLSSSDRRSFTDAAAYAEIERPLGGRGRLLGGIRLDHWGAASITAGSPRLKAEFVPARFLRAVGYWGVYRQGVPAIWMASAPGNVGLSPIASRQFGGGIEVEARRWLRLAVEGFSKRYRNYPVDPAIPSRVLVSAAAEFDSPFVGPLVSAGRVRASGIDALAQAAAGSHLQIAANYSHWRVSQLGLDRVWRRAEHEVRNQARIELSYRPNPDWSAGLRWRRASGHPYTPFSVPLSIKRGRAVYDLARINAMDYPAYARADVRVDRTFRSRAASALAYLEINNLTDHDNVLMYNWSRALKGPKAIYQWGRTVVAGVRVEF